MAEHERPRVLIVDDESDQAEDLAAFVSEHLRCDVVGNPGSGMEALRGRSYDLVLLDIDLQAEVNGIELLRRMKEFDPDLPVVMLTKSAELADIVESIKAGAFHYVTKQAEPSVHDIVHISEVAIQDARMRRAVAQIEDAEAGASSAIVGSSPAIMRTRREIARVAPLECSVLITGESGSGKELVARAIHAASGRAARGRFVAMNSAALPENLVESELFGHEKGAFTGAVRRHVGKFEHANRGTLLLDEIGDMPLPAQAKVLRVLQERRFVRVGGNQEVETDARVISSTNHDLAKLVDSGALREDLFFRVNEYSIRVPPLRERQEDIPELAAHFTKTAGAQMGKPGLGVSRAALDYLCENDWKRNNIRELRNAVVGAIIRCDSDTIQPGDFSYGGHEPADTLPPYDDAKRQMVERFKRRYFTQLLGVTKGSVTAAAEIAGIHRTALSRHLSQLGIDPKSFKE